MTLALPYWHNFKGPWLVSLRHCLLWFNQCKLPTHCLDLRLWLTNVGTAKKGWSKITGFKYFCKMLRTIFFLKFYFRAQNQDEIEATTFAGTDAHIHLRDSATSLARRQETFCILIIHSHQEHYSTMCFSREILNWNL